MNLIGRRSIVTFVVPLAVAWIICLQSHLAHADGRNAADSKTAARSPGNVDLRQSRVYVHVDKTGLGHEHAVEGRLKYGNLDLHGKTHSGKLVFDLTTFDADTSNARAYIGLKGTTDTATRREVNANMLGSAVLDVAKYPTATFEIRDLALLKQKSRRGRAQYRFRGNFTLHGVKRRIEFVSEAMDVNGATRFQGGFKINQTAFGIKPFSKAFGAVGVADTLTIYGDIRISSGLTAERNAGQTGRR